MRLIAVLLLASFLCSCATARGATQEQRPWCEEWRPPPAEDWVKLTDFELVPVNVEHLRDARRRLTDRTVVPISGEDASRLAGLSPSPSESQFYLIRAGIALAPGMSAQEVIARMAGPDFLEVHWSQSLRSVSLILVTSVFGRSQPYDVPVVLRANVRPERAYVSCVSAG